VQYPPIPMVNVGAQGEYDSKWIGKNQRPVDFGGYNSTGFPSPDELEDLIRKRKGWKKKIRNKGNKRQPPSSNRFANKNSAAGLAPIPPPVLPKGGGAAADPALLGADTEAPPRTAPRREKGAAGGSRAERVREQKAATRLREKERKRMEAEEGKGEMERAGVREIEGAGKGAGKRKGKGKGGIEGMGAGGGKGMGMGMGKRAGEGVGESKGKGAGMGQREIAGAGGMTLEEAMKTSVGAEPVGQKKAAWQ
jgi:hypothetical protein